MSKLANQGVHTILSPPPYFRFVPSIFIGMITFLINTSKYYTINSINTIHTTNIINTVTAISTNAILHAYLVDIINTTTINTITTL